MGQQLDVITGQSKEEEAIDFLRKHEPPEGFFLGFSGGKDSTVLKHLAELSGVKFKAYYSATGIDPPEVVHFIKRHHPDVTFCRPKESFYKLIVKKGFPTKFRRWCCDWLKKEPTRKIPLKHRLFGMRAEESSMRAKRSQIENYPKSAKNPKQILYKPIFRWTEYDIWDHIERHNLTYCSLYDQGFDRIGCVICPFLCHSKGVNDWNLKLHMERWPGIYRAFERAMEQLYEDREWYRQKAQGRAMLFEEFLDNWYKGK
jgi:phosphoadenosine phosphosulfate reductase